MAETIQEKKRTIVADARLWDAVREVAHEQRRSMSEIVRGALEADPDVIQQLKKATR